ncbi:conserved exported hypothetical protein [Rhodococcus sp. RD6.2]|uniref:hypothetical protein n=1 Tax=Rhodococcus sp. RD6.2 TaxID=260936 RepID=UPI00063B3782|nr:hypothetical protein [Rhodococcus sp. RD6.2]CRK49503.1 conserved exported hypothetical protein [Rhodococcus sp. RD6.2]
MPLKRRIEQVRQRWWLVLAVTLVAVLGALVSTLGAGNTYVGKSAMIVSSPGRYPEQDAVLVGGYVAYFNDPATQQRLRATDPNIPADATFQARAAAASPILIIEATAPDSGDAQSAAALMAAALREDVNAVRSSGNQEAVKALTEQLDAMRSREPGNVPDPAVTALQDRINTTQYDTTNMLQDLQAEAGVVASSPKTAFDLLAATAGGLVLGVLAALGVAALSTRLATADDVREKAGIEPLAEIPHGGSDSRTRLHENGVRQIVNTISRADLPRPAVVAVTAPASGGAADILVRDLAEAAALRGERVIVVQARASDAGEAGESHRIGFADLILDDRLAVATALLEDGLPNVTLLPYGTPRTALPDVLTHAKIERVLRELRALADLVIVESPRATDSAEANLLCAASDRVILVLRKNVARADETKEATRSLTDSGATVLGAVLVEESRSRRPRSTTSGTRRTRKSTPAHPAGSHNEGERRSPGASAVDAAAPGSGDDHG